MSNPVCLKEPDAGFGAAPFEPAQPASRAAAATRPMRTTPYLNLRPGYDDRPGIAMGRMAHSRGSAGPLYLARFLPMMSSSEAFPETALDARACRRDRRCVERHGRAGCRAELLRRRRRGRAPMGQLAADGGGRAHDRPTLDPHHAPVEAGADPGSRRVPERPEA